MLILTEAVYLRPELLRGTHSLMGSDYDMLHRFRLAFARQWLLGPRHLLPAWNPREVMGAPFAANLQGFPWIPTRLVLLLLDPSVAYAAGVAMAAGLAALFTWLYCRRAGMSAIGAAAAGWTFACAGYFSSRVMAGHLPLLEAYPALPLLLWLVDLAMERAGRAELALLAVSCTCVVVAGHPQVPAYAMVCAFVYVAWHGRGVAGRVRARVAGAMALGVGMALTFWWPMLLLIAKSTRIQHLAAPDNDVAMPYSRLLALIVPGIQGWAEPVELADKNPFTGYPNNAWFWDTASYVGILPLVAVVGLLVWCMVRRRMPGWRGRYLTGMGVAALVCSLPLAEPLLHALPGTFLRSPARLLYISTFCAAVALGAGVDALRRVNWPGGVWVRNGLLIALLAVHFVDLRGFAHWFVQTYPRDDAAPAFSARLEREIGNGRIAAEREDLVFSYGDRFDDAGGFDSIFLARFNQAYLSLAGLPPDTNQQVFDASTLPVAALEALGVRFVITTQTRDDLELADSSDGANLYRVPNPMPRASFFAGDKIDDAGKTAGSAGTIEYSRPSSDEIGVRTSSGAAGFVYVLESFDPGWKATVDGKAAPVAVANGFAMGVPVPAGEHTVTLHYETPGRVAGLLFSGVSLLLLIALIVC